jgi:hypothetical protein
MHNGGVSRSLVFCSILLTIVCFLVLFHLTMVFSVLLFTPYILIPLISLNFFNEFSFPFSIIMAVVRVVVVDVICHTCNTIKTTYNNVPLQGNISDPIHHITISFGIHNIYPESIHSAILYIYDVLLSNLFSPRIRLEYHPYGHYANQQLCKTKEKSQFRLMFSFIRRYTRCWNLFHD